VIKWFQFVDDESRETCATISLMTHELSLMEARVMQPDDPREKRLRRIFVLSGAIYDQIEGVYAIGSDPVRLHVTF